MMKFRETSYRHNVAPETVLKIAAIFILAVVALAGAFFYLFEIDFINYLPNLSLCPFHAITGIPCPGCGMTRAMLSLGQLKLREAIGFNFFSLPLLISMIIWLWPGKFPSFIQHRAFGIITFAAIIIAWLVRLLNLQVI